jgi:hypothetical protein
MNNSTPLNATTAAPFFGFYLPKKQWFAIFRSMPQQWIDVSLIPLGIIGIILNILALIVMRSDKFNLPFYTYLRAYTYWSIVICAVNSIQFTSGSRTLFGFTNSKVSTLFYAYIFFPGQYVNNCYGSLLDIVLSMERVVLLSKSLSCFRKINPKLLCFIFFIFSLATSGPYFFFMAAGGKFELPISRRKTFTFYTTATSRFRDSVNSFILYAPYFFEIFPIVFESVFNVLSIYLIRMYTKNKMKITATTTMGNQKTGVGRRTMLQDKSVSIVNQTNAVGESRRSANAALRKSRKMEIKLTILVIFMSTLSTM